LYVAKILSQEDSKFADHVLQDVKKLIFFTSNTIILQFMWSNFLKLFAHIILIFQSKILHLNLKNKIKNEFMQFALKVAILECSFLKHCQQILGVNWKATLALVLESYNI
jgi:hypothetical protein